MAGHRPRSALEDQRREQAIQYVDQRYGELGAAMTAKVIPKRQVGRS